MRDAKRNLSVQVVMADDFERERIAALLARVAGTVREARDGREGLRLWREHRPDMVLTDMVLPVLDGPDMIAAIREDDEDVPVLVAYDLYNPKVLLKAVEMNIDAFLRMPVRDKRLLEAVRRCARTVFMRKKLEKSDTMLWNLLDVFPGMALLEHDGRTVYANRKLAAYLGFDSHRHMHAAGASLGGNIVEINGEPYQGGDSGWVRTVVDDQLDRDQVLRIKGRGNPSGVPGVFTVTHSPFPNSRLRLFSFQDISELEDERAMLQDEASTDPLTQALNRRSFLRLLDAELAAGHAPGLVMFDIDHFKSINDEYGHDVGDAVLREISALVRDNIRETDRLARWGGEEFMVLSPGSSMQRTAQVAERLRRAVESFSFTGVPRPVTSSFGAAVAAGSEDREAFVKRVDMALYQAKEGGRNRVVQG
ncbi:GGDEF domain-containing response regulator [Pseudodesulfovibrio senegalensis]|nr:diguanylate cyclase [Pseudodesulfovibrio senegalensis]